MYNYDVLMSVYAADTPEWLSIAIDSMISQTIPPSSFVLVVDGPVGMDLNQVIIEYDSKYPGLFRVVRLDENVGLGPALNAGLSFCVSQVIARMDADDWSSPDRCEKQLIKLQEGFDMVGCNISEFENDVNVCRSVRLMPETHEEIVSFSHRRSPFPHPGFMVRRCALSAVGGYRSVRFAEDYDLFLRLLSEGYRGWNIQESLVHMRVNNDAYRRRGGLTYLCDMLSFNILQYREGRVSFKDFIARSSANVIVSILPNNLRDWIYRKVLRQSI